MTLGSNVEATATDLYDDLNQARKKLGHLVETAIPVEVKQFRRDFLLYAATYAFARSSTWSTVDRDDFDIERLGNWGS